MHMQFHESPCLASSRDVLDILERAVELDPRYAHARAAYAWLLVSSVINGWAEDHLSTFAAGRAQLDAALELDNSDPQTQYYIGAANLYIGRFEVAVQFLKKSLASNPHQPNAVAHLALARGYLEDFARSYIGFDQAERMASNQGETTIYYWYRGIVLGLEGRYEEAIPILEHILEILPRYATPRVTLAIAYEMTGHSDKAKAAVERACQLDPGLNVDGIAMLIAAHPDPTKGREREAILRKYWPNA
jgi:tetratricopeptide (TPR) repeat protein